MLIMILIGVYYGIFTESTMYLMKTKADLWVGQEGIRDTWHTIPSFQEVLMSR